MMVHKTDRARWHRMHSDPAARQSLSPQVRESWERSIALGIHYEKVQPEELPYSEFNAIMRRIKRLFVYAGSVIAQISHKSDAEPYATLLFDETGCLVRIFATDKFLPWAESHGIRVGTRWSEEVIGANVVSLGTRLNDTVLLTGEENFAHFLADGRFSYTPIRLEDGRHLGGVVMASPVDSEIVNLRQMSTLIARSIELQYFWFDTIANYGNLTEGAGMLVLDQSNGQNRVLVLSNEAVRMLGLPDKDYFYIKLERVIDPLPQNRRFWDIINNKQIVQDETLTLLVKGRRVVISASSNIYKEEKFHMHGLGISINSIKRINKLVSQYAGNDARYTFDNVIGRSEAMEETIRHANNLASTDSNILIQGESGVGKDVFAQAIHLASKRSGRPFVAVNCAAFSKELITSELFGYESGAFTGAKKEGAIGKFELANKGTLFLDEIGDMPLDLQAVLLRVVEEKNFRRVGGNELVYSDVRIIAATNQSLKQKIEQRLFREDLYYRLGTLKLTIPPLRKRGDDLFLLADTFSAQICARLGKPAVQFTTAARIFMRQYKWSGNVRELQNLLEGIISTHDDEIIDEFVIRDFLGEQHTPPEDAALALPAEPRDVYYGKADIELALRRCHNNKAKAAKLLGVSRSTLYRWMEKYDIHSRGGTLIGHVWDDFDT